MRVKCSLPVRRLLKRQDFVRLTKRGKRQVTDNFILQSLPNGTNSLRLGFTASKKVGGAVQRNRAKRRLRGVMDDLIRLNPNFNGDCVDIVVVARAAVLAAKPEKLRADMKQCLEAIGCSGC